MLNDFKPVLGYENLYEISSHGEVRSLKRKRMVAPFLSCGYVKIRLCKNGFYKHKYIHRLVAESHIREEKGMQVNHIDGNKQNNCVLNLEWVTQLENQRHANISGLRRPKGPKITTEELMNIIAMQKSGLSISSIAKTTRRSERGIYLAISRYGTNNMGL